MCWVMPPASPDDDIGVANGVEQRGLAVVDMAHDGHDGRARLEVLAGVGRVEQALLDVGLGDALDRVAHFLGDELRRVGVDHIGDLVHVALLHQQADHVDAALRHAVGEFLNGDGLGQDDFARDFFLLLAAPKDFSRCVRRRNDATERVRSSSPPAVAVETVRRPLFLCSPPRDGAGRLRRRSWRASSDWTTHDAFGFGGLLAPAAGATPACAPAWRGGGASASAPPDRRRRASSSELRLVSASRARRLSSSRLRASAAGRSTRSRSSRSARAVASTSARRRSSSSRERASTSARARASRSSSVSARSTTPAPRGARGAGRGVSAFAGAAEDGGAAGGGAAGAGAGAARLLRHAPGRVVSPSRPRPPSSGRGRSSDAPCRVQSAAASDAASSTERRSRSCRRCSRSHSSSFRFSGYACSFEINRRRCSAHNVEAGQPPYASRRGAFAAVGGKPLDSAP